jgi:excisionase family DNA binding protein
MAQNYYTVEKTAEVLGITPEEVRAMRERHELYGFRDGSNWKFKVEDIEKFARGRTDEEGDNEDGDVLLSELALGESGTGRSGTILPMDEELLNPHSDIKSAKKPAAKPKPAEDDLTLAVDDDEFSLADSTIGKGKDPGKSEVVGDEELVLGGSGSGSDITMGGDSGINLLDPADSGLSLEAPIQLMSGGDDSLELGEDDMISLNEDSGSESPTRLKADEEFLLTPASDSGDDDDSESGSQVIALDSEPAPANAATMIGTPSTAAMVAMLDEEPGMGPLTPLSPAAGVSAAAAGMAAVSTSTMAATAPETVVVEAALPETPFTGLQIFGVSACAVLLILCGIMISEVVRTMGTWSTPNPVASTFMDKVLSMVDGNKQ